MKHFLRPYRKVRINLGFAAFVAASTVFWRCAAASMPRRRKSRPSLRMPVRSLLTPTLRAIWVSMSSTSTPTKRRRSGLKSAQAPSSPSSTTTRPPAKSASRSMTSFSQSMAKMLKVPSSYAASSKRSLRAARSASRSAAMATSRLSLCSSPTARNSTTKRGARSASAPTPSPHRRPVWASSPVAATLRLEWLPHVSLYQHSERGRDG